MPAAYLSQWVSEHVDMLVPLQTATNLAIWRATASGQPDDYESSTRAELALNHALSNRQSFSTIRTAREQLSGAQSVLGRQLDVLHRGALANQFDLDLMDEIAYLSTQISERFNLYRAHVDGQELNDNEVEHVLHSHSNVDYRRRVWEASKGIGAEVADSLRALVKLRNRAAHQLGYRNYYALALELGEQHEAELIALVEDMAARTDAPFHQLKSSLDASLADRYGISVQELRPWHYEDRFFQEPPSAGSIDLDPYYAGADVVGLAAWYFESLGLPARDVIDRSDLFPRPGKFQHAYCMDVDRRGDVRVMCSVDSSQRWMDTMLHELGHAVYDLGVAERQELPYTLRSPSHIFTTEGVALLLGRMSANPHWMRHALQISPLEVEDLSEPLRSRARRAALVFARWCMVMVFFERALYQDPDQDLCRLWWRLVKRFQFVNPPDDPDRPDWASKIHLVGSPVYYHNYLLGELYAAQLHHSVCDAIYPGQDPWTVTYAGDDRVGRFLKERVFYPGAVERWERFVRTSTGEPLSAGAFGRANYHARMS